MGKSLPYSSNFSLFRNYENIHMQFWKIFKKSQGALDNYPYQVGWLHIFILSSLEVKSTSTEVQDQGKN